MKNPTTFYLILSLLFLSISPATQAQMRASKPALPGYWNLETNLTTHDYTIVRFYNGQDELVYEERLSDLCLNLSGSTGRCRRTRRQLSQVLQQVLREPTATFNATLIAQQLGNSRRVQRLYAVR